jgi:phosphate-selective porin OprO/OprP
MRKGILLTIGLGVLGLMLLVSIPPAAADSSAKLIEILIKKGILTKEEAQALKEEAEKEEKQPQVRTAAGQPASDPEKQPAEWTQKVEVGYKNGAYIKTSDDRFLLKMNVGVQPLFQYQDEEEGKNETTFKIRRARFYASGNAFYPWMKYYTQLTLEGGDVSLRDAYLEADYLNWLQPRAGQFKVPFDREFLDSGFALQFIERSIASSQFSLQRDIGVQLGGELLDNRLQYMVGMFNGSGANQNNVDTDYMYAGRLSWSPFGYYPYAQPLLNNPQNPLFALGAAAAWLPGFAPGERKSLAGPLGNTDLVPVNSNVFEFTGDLAFKYKPFSLMAGYYFRNIDPEKPTQNGSTNAWGVYAQAGYFLIPERFELAARYSYIDPDNPTGIDDNREHEADFGVNYYLYGQRIKTQLN